MRKLRETFHAVCNTAKVRFWVVSDGEKVVWNAEAASIASLLLTTEAVIAEAPEDKKKGAPPMPGGDMDY